VWPSNRLRRTEAALTTNCGQVTENTIAAAKDSGARILLPGVIYNYGPDAFPIFKEDSPLRYQNQPPDGTRPLKRR
jgi:hypothetical protein